MAMLSVLMLAMGMEDAQVMTCVFVTEIGKPMTVQNESANMDWHM